MCQCLMAEFNVPSLWVCEIRTCEHTSCPPRREPSDLLLVLELMKRLSFVISMIACSSHICRCCKCTAMIPSSLFCFTFPEIPHRFSQNRKVQNHIFRLHSLRMRLLARSYLTQHFLSLLKNPTLFSDHTDREGKNSTGIWLPARSKTDLMYRFSS